MIPSVLKRINPFSKSQTTDIDSGGRGDTAKEGEGIVYVSTDSLIALRRFGEQLQLNVGKALAMQSGAYHSAFRGRGMEFDEARPYQPGDDVRSIDWRITARTGKPYTKLFREERERPILICVDFRQTMFFATRGKFKSVCASELAATIAWCAISQGDRLGGLFFSDTEHTEIRPQRGKTPVLHFMKGLSSQTQTFLSAQSTDRHTDNANNVSLQSALMRLRRVAKPGSLIFIISDFRQFDQQAESHLTDLARHCEIVLLCVNDPLERELPQNGLYRMKSQDTDITIDTSAKGVREDYHSEYLKKIGKLEQYSRSHQMHLSIFSTTDDVVALLGNVLRKTK